MTAVDSEPSMTSTARRRSALDRPTAMRLAADEYLRFADEGHGVVKLHNRLVAYPAIAAFLDAHLRA